MVMLLALALAGPPDVRVEDDTDAAYAILTLSGEQALPYLAAQVRTAPDDATRILLWMQALSAAEVGPHDRQVVLPQALRWADEHRDNGAKGAVVALARALASQPATMRAGRVRGVAGPWCDEAATDLASAGAPPDGDDAPEVTFAVLSARAALASTCGWDEAIAADALVRHAASGEAGPARELWARLDDPASAALVPTVAASSPAALVDVARAIRFDHAEVSEAVEDALGGAAHDLAREARTSRVIVAIELFEALRDTAGERAARQRLYDLDPDNGANAARLAALGGTPSSAVGVMDTFGNNARAAAILDPTARLEALEAMPFTRATPWWTRSENLQARADALIALGREREAMAALRGGLRAGLVPHHDFAAQALLTGRMLPVARRAMQALLREPLPDLEVGGATATDEAEAWRVEIATDYALLASLEETMGRERQAREALEASFWFDQGVVDVRLRLGLATAEDDPARARDLIATGLAMGAPTDATLEQRGRERLVGLLDETSVWLPAGVHGYLEALRADTSAATPFERDAVIRPGRPMPDVSFSMDGETAALADIEGPVVIDLWATWCQPCLRSLPHLDDLARRLGDRATFIALSTDSDEAAALAWRTRNPSSHFRFAWGGHDVQTDLGVAGIPHTILLDADHRVVAEIHGYTIGDTRLDAALDRMLPPR